MWVNNTLIIPEMKTLALNPYLCIMMLRLAYLIIRKKCT